MQALSLLDTPVTTIPRESSETISRIRSAVSMEAMEPMYMPTLQTPNLANASKPVTSPATRTKVSAWSPLSQLRIIELTIYAASTTLLESV